MTPTMSESCDFFFGGFNLSLASINVTQKSNDQSNDQAQFLHRFVDCHSLMLMMNSQSG